MKSRNYGTWEDLGRIPVISTKIIDSAPTQASHNTAGAASLLIVIKRVDRCLARQLKQQAGKGRVGDEELDEVLQRLPVVLQSAAVVLYAYSGRGFFKRFLLSSYDEGQFLKLTNQIKDAMHVSHPQMQHIL